MGKGEQTRNAILDQALAASSSMGLAGLSIGGLARDVGMSKSGLIGHFQSKEDLQLQVLHTGVERFIEIVVAPALRERRGEPRVQALFDRWKRWDDAEFLPGGCVFMAVATELDDQPGPLRDSLVAAQADWLATLATAARIAVEEGHFRSDLDLDQFAYEFHSILLAHHFFARLMRDPNAGQRSVRTFERLLRTARVDSATP